MKAGQLVRLKDGRELRVLENRRHTGFVTLLEYFSVPTLMNRPDSVRWRRQKLTIRNREIEEVLEDVDELEEEEDRDDCLLRLDCAGDLSPSEVGRYHIGENVLLEGEMEGASFEVDVYITGMMIMDSDNRPLEKVHYSELGGVSVRGIDLVLGTERGSRASDRYWLAPCACIRRA